jgi:putative tryptophan/tyrosine transport system substrate-binding protein
MERRNFIAAVGSVVVSHVFGPLPVNAQQGERMRRIGVLSGGPATDDPDNQARWVTLTQALQQFGWIEGRNLQIDYRLSEGNADRARKFAAELVAFNLDLIVASGTGGVQPLLQATRTLPIVFINVTDPVGAGLVDSLARPGGNATGFVQLEYNVSAKWLELLKQIAPSVTRAAVLRDPTITAGIGQFAVIQSVAPSLGIDVSPINVRNADEIDRVVTAFAQTANGGLIVTGSGSAAVHRTDYQPCRTP